MHWLRAQSPYFTTLVLVFALFVSVVSVRHLLQVLPAPSTASAAVSSAGQPRNVDVQQVKKMIRENKLSDHEADFYKKAE